MSTIINSQTDQMKDIFNQMINFQYFEKFLHELPFETIQMINKQTLKIKSIDNDEILKAAPSSCSYVDEDFFKQELGEDPENPSCITHSCIVRCIRVDWVLNKPEGLRFLRQMLKQQNRDLFMTIYIKVLVHFLYQKYKTKIMKSLLPPYLMHLFAVMI